MKKIFTFAAALLASLSMMAESTTITWVPTEADVTSLVSGSTHSVTAGNGASIFELRAARPWSGDNSTVKLAWANPGVQMTDNGMLKASIAVFVPSTSNDIENIVFYLHTTGTRKTYYYEGTSLAGQTGTVTTDALAKTSTAYTFWTTFAKETYYVIGGKNGGSGETYYDSIKVTFTEGTGITKYTVTYMNGENVLGTEKVVEGETATHAADFQTIADTEFQGWFNDAAFTSAADFTAAITADKTFYGKFITVASSAKDLTSLVLSNGVKAAIVNSDHTVIGAYAGTEPTIASQTVSPKASFAQAGNTLTVTAEDGTTQDYTLALTEITPLASFTSGDTIKFNDTTVVDYENGGYIFSRYGWDSSKQVKFAKAQDDPTNMRILDGRSRVYMFLPACDTVKIIGAAGVTSDRKVKVTVNGEVKNNETLKSKGANAITVVAEQAEGFVLGVESDQTGGDAGIGAIILIKNGSTPTAIDNVEAAKAIKVIENGQIVIIKNGVRYNMLGK